jgi:SAM-dependent methyltransferase
MNNHAKLNVNHFHCFPSPNWEKIKIMNSYPSYKLFFVAFLLLVFSNCRNAREHNFEAKSGQEGKDVVWVPTSQALVDKMLDMAEVTPEDYVMDLGSGDGRLVISAAKRGATALGIEYNPDMVALSRKNAADEGVSYRATFVQGDLFEKDLSEATVVTLFLLPKLNLKLRPQLLDLKPGTRIVSNTFNMDDWEPDETATVHEDCDAYCNALLWIVPAKVEGKWKLDQGELTLYQHFQMIFGNLNRNNTTANLTEGRMNGNEITFFANGTTYSGTVSGDRMEGTFVEEDKSGKWSASRQEK